MHDLSNEQRLKLTIVLMEYLNASDWKGLFESTGCEEFAQEHTQFYEDVSWENETLEQDCTEAVEFILTKDSENIKVIWGLGGVQTILNRKDEDLYNEIEVLIETSEASEVDANSSGSTSSVSIETPDVFDTKESVYKALEDAESLLTTQGTASSYDLIRVTLKSFLMLTCTNKNIIFTASDSNSVLLSKVNDHIKGQTDIQPKENVRSDKTCSMLRAASLIINTIDDLRDDHSESNQTEDLLIEADAKFAIHLVRSIMIYIDELVS